MEKFIKHGYQPKGMVDDKGNTVNLTPPKGGSAVHSWSPTNCYENTQVCTNCLICGAEVPLHGERIELKVCNDCKRAVLAIREAQRTEEIRKHSAEVEMIVITTMDSLPELCYECPCHDGENGQCNADKERRYNLEYRPYWCPLKEIHDDREGYVSVPFSWLVKFCTHIDFNEPMLDADREKLWKQKLKQQFNIDIP